MEALFIILYLNRTLKVEPKNIIKVFNSVFKFTILKGKPGSYIDRHNFYSFEYLLRMSDIKEL